MLEKRYGWTITADIHGMREDEAKRQLELLLSRADKTIRDVVVVHGYRGGNVLRDMVRNKLKHPRIRRKMVTLNQGQTLIELKEIDK